MSLINLVRQLLSQKSSTAAARSRHFKQRQAARHRKAFLESLEPRTLLASDFGDAPDTGEGAGTGNYRTLLADNGPRHVIDTTQTTLFLGARVDSEAEAVQ